MSKFGRVLAPGALLALTVCLALASSSARAFDDDDKAILAAQKDVLDLAKEIAEGKSKDISAKAGAIKKKYEELNTIMHGYKPSTKKGIGTGIGKPGPGDGIEFNLNNYGKRALAPGTLAKNKDALVRIGYINAAIAEITLHYPPTKKSATAAKEWKQFTEDMKKASHEFVAAAKSGDPEKVKTAANNLNNSCNECHAKFRDNP